MQAERLLLRAALDEDPRNSRFVLLSESCVPMFDFAYIRAYLLDGQGSRRSSSTAPAIPASSSLSSSTSTRTPVKTLISSTSTSLPLRAPPLLAKSFVESSLDAQLRYPGAGMAAAGVPRWAWRKGSQWFVLTREHARLVADDVVGMKMNPAENSV